MPGGFRWHVGEATYVMSQLQLQAGQLGKLEPDTNKSSNFKAATLTIDFMLSSLWRFSRHLTCWDRRQEITGEKKSSACIFSFLHTVPLNGKTKLWYVDSEEVSIVLSFLKTLLIE